MGTLSLVPHPDHPPLRVQGIEAAIIGLCPNWLRIRWRIDGASEVLVPPFAGKGRSDGLWHHTCFEVFLKAPGETGYVELNLSPSERWAAYDFVSYRAGMAEREMPRNPDCTMRGHNDLMIFDAAIPLAGLPALPWQFSLACVIEEQDGTKSFWSLRHGPGKPDFHAPACFVAKLEAPTAP